MSSVTRPAGTDGSFSYNLSEFGLVGGPTGDPVVTIYSDAARTVEAVAAATMTATGDPNTFLGVYPASLAAGTYYLKFETELTAGDTFTDINDTLVLEAVSGSVSDGLTCTLWTTTADIALCCPGVSTANAEFGNQAASDLLYLFSGLQFPGLCSKTIRPCRVDCRCRCNHGVFTTDHVLWNAGCDGCCPARILLDDFVTDISTVRLDGAFLAETEYRLDENRYLTRMADSEGRSQSWPCTQRLDRAVTEEDTFEIVYSFGSAPPPMGKRAAARLACEIAKGCAGKDCALPQRAIQVVRQGVTIDLDPREFLNEGKLGIYEVDIFLMAVNPSGRRGRARAYSPDVTGHLRG